MGGDEGGEEGGEEGGKNKTKPTNPKNAWSVFWTCCMFLPALDQNKSKKESMTFPLRGPFLGWSF